MIDNEDQRTHPRIEVSWPVQILTDQETIEGEVLNVSSTGLYIRCEKPLELNEIFRMVVKPDNHEEVEIQGQIVWSSFYAVDETDAPVSLGISLIEISQKDGTTIDQLF